MKNYKQKSIYLAVLLATTSMPTLAEEIAEKPQQQLEEVTVKSTKESQQDGYQGTKTRVGKTLQDPHDIPQAVTTVTRSLMHDQQVSTLKDALRNVSGLTL